MATLPTLQISEKIKSIPEALSIYMNNVVYAMKRRGDKISVLSLGEAYFNIPMFPFDELDFNKGYHYSESLGLPELRNKIANYYKHQYNAPVNSEIIIYRLLWSEVILQVFLFRPLSFPPDTLFHIPSPGHRLYRQSFPV